jgi:anti-sigma regulatory factor (Ser/Thr protein kinase)
MAGSGFDQPHLTMKFWETIESRPELLEAAVERILRLIDPMPCAAGIREEVRVALSEALSNAVIHGNRQDPAKKVEVFGGCDGDILTLVITDEGEGFDPAALPDPTSGEHLLSAHGRGVFLIHRLMDHVEYRRGGSQIILRKRSSPTP